MKILPISKGLSQLQSPNGPRQGRTYPPLVCSLEDQLQSELNLPRTSNSIRDFAKIGVISRPAIHRLYEDSVIRRTEIRVIGNIEELGAELNSEIFGNAADKCLFQYREVRIDKTWAVKGITRQVAKGASHRKRESRGISILEHISCPQDDIVRCATSDQIGSLIADQRPRLIEADDRVEWSTALLGKNSTDLPALYELISFKR